MKPPRIALWLFLSFLGLYLLGTSGHIHTPDGVIMFRVTQSLLSQGRLDIPELPDWPGFGGIRLYTEGQAESVFYAKYGLGLSLAAAPTYLLGQALLPLAGEGERSIFGRRAYYDTSATNFPEAFLSWTASWTNSLVLALCIAGLFLVCRELGYSLRISAMVAAAAGLGTPIWHYSKTFFSEPLAALGLLFFFLFSVRGHNRAQPARWWLLAGAMLGLAALTKVLHVLLLLPAGILLLGYARQFSLRRALGGLAAASLGFLTIFSLSLLYNYLRFGSVLETGYGQETERWSTAPLEGALGLLASPGRGLLLYLPLWMLAALGLQRFAKRLKLELFFILVCLALLVGTYAQWHMWEGGWCWGPRFLVPVIPLLVLPLAAFLEQAQASRWRKIAALAISGLALVVAVNGLLVSFVDYYGWMKWMFGRNVAFFQARGVMDYYDLLRWDFRYSPLVAYWTFPIKEYFLLPRALQHPGLVLTLFGIFSVLLVGGALLLLRALRPARPGAQPEAGHCDAEAAVPPAVGPVVRR